MLVNPFESTFHFMIQGLTFLLLFQSMGELLSHFWLRSIPGPVIGLLLLLLFLLWRGRIPADIETAGSGILRHLGLFFVPASVGVITYWPMLKTDALAVVVALVVSVAATIGVTGWVLKRLAGDPEGDEHAR